MNKRFTSLIALLSGFAWILLSSGGQGLARAHHNLEHSLPPATSSKTSQTITSQTITIEFGGPLGFAYSPKDVFLSPGDSLHWQGSFSTHPLVSDEGLWQTVNTGSEFTFTFDQPGIYHFHCFFHSSIGMNGTVTVGYWDFLPLIQK